MSNDAHARAVIQGALSGRTNTIKRIDDGWTNIVYEVNGHWIFRFIRDPSNSQLGLEQAFLPFFAEQAPLPIPKIQHSGPDYIAYEKIAGAKFSERVYARLSADQKETAAKTLGHFLARLHAAQFEHEHLQQFPFGSGDFWHDLWPVVSPRLNDHVRQRAEVYFHHVLAIISSTAVNKVITHSDFGTNNVLVDEGQQGNIVGVIDFGDLSIGDRAVDFATFYRRFDKSFAASMLAHYTLPVEDNFWIRVDYEAKRKLFFVVYFALKHGYEESVPAVVRAIERQFDS